MCSVWGRQLLAVVHQDSCSDWMLFYELLCFWLAAGHALQASFCSATAMRSDWCCSSCQRHFILSSWVMGEMLQAGHAAAATIQLDAWTSNSLCEPTSTVHTLSHWQSAWQCLVVSLTFCLCLTAWPPLPCSWTQHKFIYRRKEPSSSGSSEAVDFTLSEQIFGLQASNRCPVFPLCSVEMSGQIALFFLDLCPK